MDIQYLVKLEEKMENELLRLCTERGALKGMMLETEDITEQWKILAPEYMADAVPQVNAFPAAAIAWAGYVGMAVAHRWDEDWATYATEPYSALHGVEGFDDMDEHILQNIQSMVELAKYHHIQPVLCSCLPAAAFKWRPEMKPAEDIKRLNEMIQEYAKANKIKYIDYHSALVDEYGGLPEKYAADGVHPNMDGYAIMEQILLDNL